MCAKMSLLGTMDSNLAKCFICDKDCDSKCTNQGLYIAQTLTMPLISVLTKCLRTFVEVENEYFCCDCVGKIAEYDKLAKLSLNIETDLYRQYQNKPFRSNFLDDEFIVDQNEIRDKISDFFDFKPNLRIRNNNTETGRVIDEIDLTTSPSDVADDEPDEEEQGLIETDNVVVDEALNYISRIEQTEQLNQSDPSEQSENEEEEEEEVFSDSSEIKLKDDDGDDVEDSQRYNVAEKNVQSARNEQINVVKKRKTKRGRKRKQTNNNNNTQSGNLMSFSCNVCGRTYKSKGALGTHMVKHSDQNPHACVICKKVFTQRLGLLRHIPIHTGEQQHQCHICGKRFIHSASYNMHKKMHLDERSKKCDICGSEFRSSSHMTRHKRSHTGERPFECEICHQKFSQRYNMKTHRNTHHKIKSETKNFKCLICPETFLRREKLNEHLRQVHEAALVAD